MHAILKVKFGCMQLCNSVSNGVSTWAKFDGHI